MTKYFVSRKSVEEFKRKNSLNRFEIVSQQTLHGEVFCLVKRDKYGDVIQMIQEDGRAIEIDGDQS